MNDIGKFLYASNILDMQYMHSESQSAKNEFGVKNALKKRANQKHVRNEIRAKQKRKMQRNLGRKHSK